MHETNFPETHEQCELKMFGKKSSVKSANKRFLIHTNIVTKKWGQKMHESIFPETHDFCELKMLGKNRL